MKEILIKEYNNTNILRKKYKEPKNSFFINFTNGPICEIKGPIDNRYKVMFTNRENGKLIHSSEITNNMWTKCTREYFIDWNIKVYDLSNNELVFEHNYNAKNKKVYIHLGSSAIGDTIAWLPYVEEFRKKHGCKMICSTFHNDWFESTYPEIKFVKPGTQIDNLYAMYGVGWFYNNKEVNYNKIPVEFKNLPLQQTSSSILGLDYKEIKPKLSFTEEPSRFENKYVVIAPHASAHAKYWNNPGGWQKVVDYLKSKGYEVVMITSEKLNDTWHDSKLGGTLKGVIDKTGDHIDLKDRMIDIKNADAFIGLGSGLSWLSWAIGTPTVLISGFSLPLSEFNDCERVFTPNKDTCSGCFNREWLNAGDWEWCPDHKDTERHFECTKTITVKQVINATEKALNIKSCIINKIGKLF